jgi:hypothetical protein
MWAQSQKLSTSKVLTLARDLSGALNTILLLFFNTSNMLCGVNILDNVAVSIFKAMQLENSLEPTLTIPGPQGTMKIILIGGCMANGKTDNNPRPFSTQT